jgi:hypothetical protein
VFNCNHSYDSCSEDILECFSFLWMLYSEQKWIGCGEGDPTWLVGHCFAWQYKSNPMTPQSLSNWMQVWKLFTQPKSWQSMSVCKCYCYARLPTTQTHLLGSITPQASYGAGSATCDFPFQLSSAPSKEKQEYQDIAQVQAKFFLPLPELVIWPHVEAGSPETSYRRKTRPPCCKISPYLINATRERKNIGKDMYNVAWQHKTQGKSQYIRNWQRHWP